ncbi:MAG TPA: MraY family glycosyltransferase [Vicinamibacterales bacterium]|nr:MraY family glycosyltransferase [Vicinamibacterales bacterium]
MTVYLALLMAGAILGLLLTPLVTSASTALGLVDAPGGRKVHSTAVPRVGGLAIVVAASTALLLVVRLMPAVGIAGPDFRPLAPVILGAALVFFIGLLDDFATLPAWPKLAVQTAAAAIVMASGLLIERLTIGGSTWQLGILSYPITLVWIIGLTNAFNLLDGMDGLAAGIAVIAGTTCAALLVGRGHAAEAMLVTALVGAALGFLVFNFSPASIFLGDGGSLVFGFVLATTAITGWQKGATALAAGVPLLIFALPLADAASALVRRIFRRPPAGRVTVAGVLRQIAEPDREHIHHRLMALGWSPRQTATLLYLLTVLLSIAALLTAQYD